MKFERRNSVRSYYTSQIPSDACVQRIQEGCEKEIDRWLARRAFAVIAGVFLIGVLGWSGYSWLGRTTETIDLVAEPPLFLTLNRHTHACPHCRLLGEVVANFEQDGLGQGARFQELDYFDVTSREASELILGQMGISNVLSRLEVHALTLIRGDEIDVQLSSDLGLSELEASVRSLADQDAAGRTQHTEQDSTRIQERTATSTPNADERPGIPSVSRFVETFDSMVPELQERFKVPGVSVALIDDAEIVWAKGYGLLQADLPNQVDPDTVMEAASMGKPFYAYIVLKLAELGQIDLDRPLVEYLEQDYLLDESTHRKITARMVLSHTSGFPNWRPGVWDAGGDLHSWKDGQLVRGNPLSMLFQPGERYGYSGEGFRMLELTIEKMTGESLKALTDRMLIEPLQLRNTSFGWEDRFMDNAARGHDADGAVTDSSALRTSDTGPRAVTTSAGGLYSSARDYARFLVEMMSLDRSAAHSLSVDSIRRMLTLTSTPNPAEDDTGMGLGWMVSRMNGQPVAGHDGNNGDFRCGAYFYPESRDGMVIMTNAMGGGQLLEALDAELEKIK